MQPSSRPFPKRFLWGAATSAHQVEGGTHNQWTVWELDHANAQAAQAEYHLDDLERWPDIKRAAKRPHTYVSGHATGHYRHYEADFDLLRQLNLNAYRFSVEWSRVEPTEGAWNVEAVEHYKAYLAALKARGIEPMLTLLHFTLPVWFAEKGGFEKRRNVKYFLRFVEKILGEIGKDIRYVITINEPEIYAAESYLHGNWPPQKTSKWLFYRVLNNQLYAHRKAAKLIHGLNRRYRVAIAKNSAYTYPGDDAWLTRLSAATMQFFHDDYVLRQVRRHSDFIGVNYYFSNRIYGYRVHNPHEHTSDVGWDMQPEYLEHALLRLHDTYGLPLIVTENGLADMHDSHRKWWLGKTMVALKNALEAGADVKGYFHWSLLDNFEWAYGTWPRFGLSEVDYKTGKRTLRPSAVWWARLLATIQKEKRR